MQTRKEKRAPGETGRQLAVVACRDGQLYCMCTNTHRTGGVQEAQDISWTSSSIGPVSGTACVRSRRTGGRPEAPDISWPSSPIGAVSCTGCALSRRRGQPAEGDGPQLDVVACRGGQVYCICAMSAEGRRGRRGRKEEEGEVTEENLTTSTLTVGKKQAKTNLKIIFEVF